MSALLDFFKRQAAHTSIAISGGDAGGHGHSKARAYQTAHRRRTTKIKEPSNITQPLSGSSSGCFEPGKYMASGSIAAEFPLLGRWDHAFLGREPRRAQVLGQRVLHLRDLAAWDMAGEN